MLWRIFDAFFGCWHNRYSFPLTVKKGPRSRAAFATGTYVVCLDCGRELPYDWQDMKVITSDGAASHHLPALAPKQAV